VLTSCEVDRRHFEIVLWFEVRTITEVTFIRNEREGYLQLPVPSGKNGSLPGKLRGGTEAPYNEISVYFPSNVCVSGDHLD
jgi:hypothetical protein